MPDTSRVLIIRSIGSRPSEEYRNSAAPHPSPLPARGEREASPRLSPRPYAPPARGERGPESAGAPRAVREAR